MKKFIFGAAVLTLSFTEMKAEIILKAVYHLNKEPITHIVQYNKDGKDLLSLNELVEYEINENKCILKTTDLKGVEVLGQSTNIMMYKGTAFLSKDEISLLENIKATDNVKSIYTTLWQVFRRPWKGGGDISVEYFDDQGWHTKI